MPPSPPDNLTDAACDRLLAEHERARAEDVWRAFEDARQASEDVRRRQARLEASLAAGGIAAWAWDVASDRVTADDSMARLFGVSADEAAGGPLDAYLRAVHPDDRPRVARAIADAVAHGDDYETEFRIAPPGAGGGDGGGDGGGAARVVVARGRVARDEAGAAVGLDGVVVDVTAQAARTARARFLADLAERARGMDDPDAVIADAVRSVGEFLGVSRCLFADIDIEADTCAIRPDWRAGDSVRSLAGVVSIAAFGAHVVAEYAARRAVIVDDVRADPVKAPPESLAAYDAAGIRAHVTVPVVHTGRVVSCMSVHSGAPRAWQPAETALLRDAVERTWLTVEVLRQQRARAREAEATARTLESVTDAFFALDADWRFAAVNAQAERLLGLPRADLLGREVWAAFPAAVGSTFEREYRRAVAERAPVSFEEFFPPLDSWFEVRAFPSPDGLSVFFQDVTGRRRAEDERRRGAEALRESEERSRLLLESTADGIYGLDSRGRFTFLNRAAERMLGLTRAQVLGRPGHALIHHTRPDGSPSPEADCPISRTVREGVACRVEDDVFWHRDGRPVPVAFSASPVLFSAAPVPFSAAREGGPQDGGEGGGGSQDDGEGGAARGAVVSFSDISERKMLEAERERLAARERNIARQLQQALQPSLSDTTPGLALAKYYEAALAEAGVGGDFYDAFPLGAGRTALVVGDLSGKGLAAAAQVATVRNMLRAFLHTRPALADAVTVLNDVLAENALLSGFATLFVGVYDAAARSLAFVNCGQEPALLRRAGGAVEPLGPTGPILGGIEGARFEQGAAILAPGDALAVFTDGLTEVGVSRLAMLGLDGVSALLADAALPAHTPPAGDVAEFLALRLIGGVDAAAAAGVMRDDMCLLVAVAV